MFFHFELESSLFMLMTFELNKGFFMYKNFELDRCLVYVQHV